MVCITLDKGKVGATHRIDLARQPGHHPRRHLRQRRNLLPLRQRTRPRHQPAHQHHRIQPRQRRIHLPRQHHRTHQPNHPPVANPRSG
ncbi:MULTISPECIES: hypothetical protein [unclassified Arthrobacter]|uniref:hypothetical protein n=1 Tax=unclassified Arthrobacter TaxID=235627 RepID=UPI00280B39F7|nr:MULTISPECIES: hypothetical protein [unclassified Arthrobacter]